MTTSASEARVGRSSLALHFFLSLLFSLAMGQLILFNWDTTYELWLTWTIAWGVIWLVFALLQARWWSRGDAKFWRPIYGWTLLGYIVLSLLVPPAPAVAPVSTVALPRAEASGSARVEARGVVAFVGAAAGRRPHHGGGLRAEEGRAPLQAARVDRVLSRDGARLP